MMIWLNDQSLYFNHDQQQNDSDSVGGRWVEAGSGNEKGEGEGKVEF